MTPKTSPGWRKQLEKELGQKIPNVVWKRVIERGYIDTANEEEDIKDGEGLKYLVEVIDPLLEDYEVFRRVPSFPLQRNGANIYLQLRLNPISDLRH